MKTGVVGAGSMGAEIALVQALAGFDVLLADRSAAVLQSAVARLARLLEKRGTGSSDTLRDVLDRIQTTTNLDDFGDREIVTEAVFEDLEVKSSVLQQLTAVLAPTGLAERLIHRLGPPYLVDDHQGPKPAPVRFQHLIGEASRVVLELHFSGARQQTGCSAGYVLKRVEAPREGWWLGGSPAIPLDHPQFWSHFDEIDRVQPITPQGG